MVYSKARLEDALLVFRHVTRCRGHPAFSEQHSDQYSRSKYKFRKNSRVLPIVNVNRWQDKFGDNRSEDEEYDPQKEKLKTKARLRKGEQKRKAVQVVDQEKDVKKLKCDDAASTDISDNFVTLKLTGLKGKELLRTLDIISAIPTISHTSLDVIRSISLRSGSSPVICKQERRSRELEGLEYGILGMDCNVDDTDSSRHKMLRSGKILEQTSSSVPDRTLQHGLPSHIPEEGEPKPVQQIPTAIPTQTHLSTMTKPVTSRPEPIVKSHLQKGTENNPISLDSDSEEVIHTVPAQPALSSYGFDKAIKASKGSPRSYASNLPPNEIKPDSRFRSSHTMDSRNEGGILTIETSYAHPIDFNHVARSGDDCHFCQDYRMGIKGLGRCRVEVFTDPDKPYAYQELGNGFRSMGYSSTKMCRGCAEKRLKIIKCHDPKLRKAAGKTPLNANRQQILTDPTTQVLSGSSIFSELPNVTSEAKKAYMHDLFAKSRPRQGLSEPGKAGAQPPLHPCSLCPMPANWECCKTRHQRHLDVVLDTRFASSTFDGRCNTLNGFSPYATDTVGSHPCTLYRNRRLPMLDAINIDVDSKSGGDRLSPILFSMKDRPQSGSAQEKSPTLKQECKSSPATVPSLSQPDTFLASSAYSSPFTTCRSDSPQMQVGCGLKLCNTCKVFISKYCEDGALEKNVIMKWFREGSTGTALQKKGKDRVKSGSAMRRADIEFLFAGSVLDKIYNDGTTDFEFRFNPKTKRVVAPVNGRRRDIFGNKL